MKSFLLKVINNTDNIYEGNLHHYFKLVFNAPNARADYHNFRHMMHVACEVYDGICCMNYVEQFGKKGARALLIAAIFHDYGHKGTMGGADSENIEFTKTSLRHFILSEDKELLPEIERFIEATEFPHRKDIELTMGAQIIRDADMSPAFDDVWMQQLVFGLSREISIEHPIDFLKNQPGFIERQSKDFYTDWARKKFVPKAKDRIEEINEYLNILNA